MKWQPIETAPKDGHLFDVWVVSDFLESGFGRWYTRTAYRMTDCKWGFEDYDFEKDNPGVMFHGPDESEPWRYVWKRLEDVTPTHWIPLPEPPEATP